MSSMELLDQNVASILESQGITDLLPVQIKAIEQGLFRGTSLLVLAPTSSGKTLIGEIAAVHQALQRQRTAILVPFKALAEERYEDLSKRWGTLGLRVGLSTGDHPSFETKLLVEGDLDVVLFTYERFLSFISRSEMSIISLFSMIVIDEVQIISDKERGPKLEWILTFLRRMAFPPQLVCLSAVVGGLNDFDNWLKATAIIEDTRIVPLTEVIALPDGKCSGIVRDSTGITDLTHFIPPYQLGSPEGKVLSFVSQALDDNPDQQMLIFRDTVNNAENMACILAANLKKLGPAREAIEALDDLEETPLCTTLRRCLEHGTAFHSSELTLEERRIIETSFRKGEIKCLSATSTLAMGVNLPCNTVIIAELERSWVQIPKEKPYKVAEYRNMSGRAGRLGTGSGNGFSIYLADNLIQAKALERAYIKGTLEPLDSALSNERLDVLIMYCIAYTTAGATTTEVTEILLDTYAGAKRWDASYKQNALEASVINLMRALELDELIVKKEDSDDKYILSDFGVICVSSGLDPKSFVILLKWIKEANRIHKSEFFLMIASLPALSTIRFPNGVRQVNSSQQLVSTLITKFANPDEMGNNVKSALVNLSKSFKDLDEARHSRMAASLLAFCSGLGTGEIESRLLVPNGTMRGLKE